LGLASGHFNKAEPRMLTLKQINVQNRSTQMIDEKATLKNNMFSNVAFFQPNESRPEKVNSTVKSVYEITKRPQRFCGLMKN